MNWLKGGLAALGIFLAACGGQNAGAQPNAGSGQRAEAYFAGGCFWCMESDFEHLDGVIEVVSGYTGGTLNNPRYEDVITETTGHYESVRVIFDPARLTYNDLLNYYWRHIDPTDGGGQFCDRGPSYRPAIFVATDAQRAAAEASKNEVAHVLNHEIAVQILPLQRFWPAEGYHQDYYKKNPIRYAFYRDGCGRDRRVEQIWRGH